jgi:tripartite ATP-independent transporter DctP family solute receptor
MISLLLSCTQGDSVKRFSLPHVLNTDHPVHKALEVFAKEVETRSEGSMVIRIQPGGTLGNEQELVDNVSNDMDAFTKISSTILETKTELAKVYSLPYLFRDEEHMWKVLDGEIGNELLDMALDQNLKGICYFDAGFRSFYTKQPVQSPNDLRGMKIRVQKSVMMQELVETLGASPQQIAFSELYTALDTGVVAGAENNIPSYYTMQHYKVAPYYVFDEHVAIPDILLMSATRWNQLSPDEQQIIIDSAEVAKDYQKDLWQEANQEQIAMMKEEGVTFTHIENKQPFVDATKSIYSNFEGTEIMDYVARIRAVE